MELMRSPSQGSLFPSPDCKASTSNANSTLKLVHKHGPCSPLFNGPHPISAEDIARAKWIRSKLSGTNSADNLKDSAVSIQAKYGPGGGSYLVTIGLGTPKKDLTLLFDTGSALTWTQSPASCLAIRKPSQSLTPLSPRPMPISLALLHLALSFLLALVTNLAAAIRHAFTNHEQWRAIHGFAGLLGLARNRISLLEQSATKYGRLFSYCLPPLISSTGYLTFGKGNGRSTSVRFTPISTVSQSSIFYGINIIGISVGGKPLPIPSTVFSNAGTIIDSGTTITQLPPTAYSALRSAFRQAMSKYNMSAPASPFDTCYDLSGSTMVTTPVITFSFNGPIAVDLDPSGVLFPVNPSKMCLAFESSPTDSDLSIYGNIQQRSYEVVYDVAGGRIGFGAKGCS
ncbi:hypothetical protein NL676_035075 [Syzygium grande]|nr:hypothetical protein NL676_035075 [Syzygium grande]